MAGPQFIYAWIAGAILSLIDGMIWSELGAAYPKAGGSYNFLREAYGKKYGKFFSFLFVWQTLLLAPLVAASGAIGFSQYCSFLFPFSEIQQKMISGFVIILLVILLYKKINTIGNISVVLWVTVIITIGCKDKTIAEWDKWFKSEDEYSTERGTFEFKKIQGCYNAYKAYLKTVYGNEKKVKV